MFRIFVIKVVKNPAWYSDLAMREFNKFSKNIPCFVFSCARTEFQTRTLFLNFIGFLEVRNI
jgi:hypothetical protein